ncbi:MAG TPA: hypothetical protein VG318_15285 [Actinomycetota bacterium]|nr:hypothetical protein [Actinomycetota bacterium]
MSSRPGTALLASSVAALAVLAPIVPDEPLHLSGVMVVSGIALASAAFVAGSLVVMKSPDAEARSSGKTVMALSALTLLATAVVLLARVAAQLS